MPDWYVRRNDADAAFPYQVRLGGCEYSLTEEEFGDLYAAFHAVANMGDGPYEVQSEDYADIIVAHGTDKPRLLDILKISKPVINRRGM